MIAEYKEWMKKAERDLEAAKSNIKNGFLEEGAFFLQQSAEKALKALFIKKYREYLKIHDLVVLARKLKAPEKIAKNCARLTTLYQETRYPDSGKRSDLEEEIDNLLASTEEVLRWTKKNL